MHILQCITPCNALKHLISTRNVIIFENFEESSLKAKKIDNAKQFIQDHSSIDFFQDHCILSILLTCEFFQDQLFFFQDHLPVDIIQDLWVLSRPLIYFKAIYQVKCFKTISFFQDHLSIQLFQDHL